MRGAESEGKIKGRGTTLCEKAVCTWGWRGTRQREAACREGAQGRFVIGEDVRFAHRALNVFDGGAG